MVALRRRREEPVIDWTQLQDGGLRRFKRGKHYTGSADGFQRDAKTAAGELGKEAVVYKDQLGKFEYVWVQFLEGELEEGRACTKCGSRSLERVQKYFLGCPSCGSLYAIDTSDSGPDASAVAEITSVRMLSRDGREIVEASVRHEIVIEAACRFLRPVERATAHFTFFTAEEERKALRAVCPDTIGVPDPQTVGFSLHVAAGVLKADQYMVFPSIHIDQGPGMEQVRAKRIEPFLFHLADPASADSDDGGAQERSSLHWTIAMAASEEPAED